MKLSKIETPTGNKVNKLKNMFTVNLSDGQGRPELSDVLYYER